jgi:hypothetical protein
MSLSARQQRTLGSIESRLRADDPHLASMFAIFDRLNVDEPVSAEPPVPRLRLRWQRPRLAAGSMLLIPFMFIVMIVVSALAASPASPRACAGHHPASSNSPPLLRSACQLTADTTVMKAATVVKAASVAVPTTPDGTKNPACIALVQHGRSARGWVCYK